MYFQTKKQTISDKFKQRTKHGYKRVKIQRKHWISRPHIGPQTNVGNSHQRIKQKIVQYTGIFSKIRHCLPVPNRHTVYNAFISLRLNYGSEIYTNTTRKFTQPLIVTQNKILRILQFKNIRTPLNTLYREFGVLKLKDLHHFNVCCVVHKSIHSPQLLPVAINEIFYLNEQIHDYNTRNKKDLHPIKIRTKLYGEKTISFQGRNCWNNLPSNIKEIKSINFFKKKLKQYMFSNY